MRFPTTKYENVVCCMCQSMNATAQREGTKPKKNSQMNSPALASVDTFASPQVFVSLHFVFQPECIQLFVFSFFLSTHLLSSNRYFATLVFPVFLFVLCFLLWAYLRYAIPFFSWYSSVRFWGTQFPYFPEKHCTCGLFLCMTRCAVGVHARGTWLRGSGFLWMW